MTRDQDSGVLYLPHLRGRAPPQRGAMPTAVVASCRAWQTGIAAACGRSEPRALETPHRTSSSRRAPSSTLGERCTDRSRDGERDAVGTERLSGPCRLAGHPPSKSVFRKVSSAPATHPNLEPSQRYLSAATTTVPAPADADWRAKPKRSVGAADVTPKGERALHRDDRHERVVRGATRRGVEL